MAEESKNVQDIQALRRSLKAAIADVKTRDADRTDVVVEMKEAEAARLQLLADELRPLMQQIDEADERFDFALTKGDKPRLWIDMTSFVSMGHDKRSYRFLKDTRMGRMVLAETGDMQRAADIVSNYVAERVLERERIIEGEWIAQRNYVAGQLAENDTGEPETIEKGEEETLEVNAPEIPSQPVKRGFGRFFWFLFGATFGLAALVAAAFLFARDAL